MGERVHFSFQHLVRSCNQGATHSQRRCVGIQKASWKRVDIDVDQRHSLGGLEPGTHPLFLSTEFAGGNGHFAIHSEAVHRGSGRFVAGGGPGGALIDRLRDGLAGGRVQPPREVRPLKREAQNSTMRGDVHIYGSKGRSLTSRKRSSWRSTNFFTFSRYISCEGSPSEARATPKKCRKRD